MKKEIKPKLTFEVGEKVVIVDSDCSFTNNRDVWPNKNKFTISTITQVNEDGSVVVEGRYVYRQSYKTEFGELDIHDYFRIKTTPSVHDTTFNSTEYHYWNGSYYVSPTSRFYSVTYLFKLTKEFEDKMVIYQRESDARIAADLAQEKENEEKEAKRKPHLDAYNAIISPLEEKLFEKKLKTWKKLVCANCKFNHDGKCSERHNRPLKEINIYDCSDFEGK